MTGSQEERLDITSRHRNRRWEPGRGRLPLETKRPLYLVSIMAAGALVATSPVAFAGPCPPTDVQCTVDEAVNQVGDAVDQGAGGAAGAVEDATKPPSGAGGAAGAVEDATKPPSGAGGRSPDPIGAQVDETVQDVTATADEALGPVRELAPQPPPPPSGESLPPVSSEPDRQAISDEGRTAAPTPSRSRYEGRWATRRVTPAQVLAARPEVPDVPDLESQVEIGASRAPAAVSLAASSQPEPSGTRALPAPPPPELLRQLTFPMLLAAMILAFLLIQDRLDRRDPKLAEAPVEGDNRLLHFR